MERGAKKIKDEMDKGRFCFIVYPIIQESEKIVNNLVI